ncbi:uncharacterized protein LOC143287207 [Babylonia areolata]|uniref:uncharacterized protein LOC143287207 n=1 Tax=Babylonia areolata TaxID=304850 RepID=UPI003FD14CE1
MSARSEDVMLLRRITSAIDFWVPPFLFFVGTFTNTLVVMVMRSKHFRHMSTSFYMAVSAVVDTVSLLVPLPPHYLYVNFPHIFDSVRHVHVICAICHPSGWITSNLGVFLTVAMTIDRSLAIQFPLKAPTLCTVRKAKIVTVCLLLLELLVEGHVAFTTRVVPKGVLAYLCAVDTSFSDTYRIFHDIYWPYIHNVGPRTAKDLGEGAKSSGGTQSGKTSSKSRQLSLMLVIDSVSIITCTMPLTLYMMLFQSFQSINIFDNSPVDQATQGLLFAIGFYLIQVNHCANFFLYCLSGARFREALKEVVLPWKLKHQDNRFTRFFNKIATVSSISVNTQGDLD